MKITMEITIELEDTSCVPADTQRQYAGEISNENTGHTYSISRHPDAPVFYIQKDHSPLEATLDLAPVFVQICNAIEDAKEQVRMARKH